MKNKRPLSFPKQPAFIIEAAPLGFRAGPRPAAFKIEAIAAFFRPALLSKSNTFLYLAIGQAKNLSGKTGAEYVPVERAAEKFLTGDGHQ